MASRAGKETFVSVWSASQSFLFCDYFSFLIAKSKRFGGLSKYTQAFNMALYALFVIAILSCS